MRAFWADLWRRKWFRWTFTPVAALAVTWLSICLILNYVGEKRWQEVKARLKAEGETLDYFTLLPPPIPDEQNFCAIEALNGIRALDGDGEASVLARRKRDAISAQAAFLSREMLSALWSDGLNSATGTDDQEILKAFGWRPLRSVRLPPLDSKSAPTISWREARADMERHAPILAELHQAAGRRLQADYLPRPLRHELPEIWRSMSNKHLNVAQDLGHLCRGYSIICLKEGDVRMSLDSARVILRLADGAQSNRWLIGNLVAATQQTQFISLVWLYLKDRCLDEGQMELLQDELRRFDPAQQHLASLRSEIAMSIDSMEYLQAHPAQRWRMTRDLVPLGPSPLDPLLPWLCAMIPSGYFDLCKASMAELQHDHIIQHLKKSGLQNLAPQVAGLESLVQTSSGWKRADLFFLKFFNPTVSAIHETAIFHGNLRLQALWACALERHFLRHGAYPDSLAALDRDLASGLSLLDVNGKEMHYTVVARGRFRLWSPGPNGVDDGGKFGEEVAPGSTKSITSKRYQGDWVWRYDPAVKKP